MLRPIRGCFLWDFLDGKQSSFRLSFGFQQRTILGCRSSRSRGGWSRRSAVVSDDHVVYLRYPGNV